MPDVNGLDAVLLTRTALRAWAQIAFRVGLALAQGGEDPEVCPDEDCDPLPDGSLRIFVPGHEAEGAELIIPAEHWAWRTEPARA